jgi:hypothetical protein
MYDPKPKCVTPVETASAEEFIDAITGHGTHLPVGRWHEHGVDADSHCTPKGKSVVSKLGGADLDIVCLLEADGLNP